MEGYLAGKALDKVWKRAGEDVAQLNLRLRFRSNFLFALSLVMLFWAVWENKFGKQEIAKKAFELFFKAIVVAGATQAIYSKDAELRFQQFAISMGVAGNVAES